MGMFGGLKNRLLHKDEDLGDVRSRVLEERRFTEPEPMPEPVQMEEFANEPLPPRRPIEVPRFTEFGEEGLEEPARKGGYEVIDRLNFIENQLSAIKAQTETINERLKNMELKLGRRY